MIKPSEPAYFLEMVNYSFRPKPSPSPAPVMSPRSSRTPPTPPDVKTVTYLHSEVHPVRMGGAAAAMRSSRRPHRMADHVCTISCSCDADALCVCVAVSSSLFSRHLHSPCFVSLIWFSMNARFPVGVFLTLLSC